MISLGVGYDIDLDVDDLIDIIRLRLYNHEIQFETSCESIEDYEGIRDDFLMIFKEIDKAIAEEKKSKKRKK